MLLFGVTGVLYRTPLESTIFLFGCKMGFHPLSDFRVICGVQDTCQRDWGKHCRNEMKMNTTKSNRWDWDTFAND